MLSRILLTVTGTRPMLMHSSRLANPLDEYTRALKSLTGKKKKTDEDLARIAEVELRGGCWETDEGLLGVPNEALFKSIIECARLERRGKDIERAVIFDDVTNPIHLDGKTIHCDHFCSEPRNMDYRTVVVSGRRTMRARPKIPTGWKSLHEWELMTDIINVEDFIDIAQRAGTLIGLGDRRPRLGRYELGIELRD